ncbi:NAD-dependent epimerase/dehydratase family protein [Actinomycetospora lemnae]|uniref:NAD-dependent epimerase/dehydratase family protein n=1 Tax=Actinomycetospora lemnae TaxID=3019891 RepID=A0ABT5SNK8_9PSEU|nr:NAD-dependent epimerase/dehydratase family protein [Actinomycetospora sp. DW7H6]MDD7964070.1 NAD-dependent epimerase/dehydratase family protein [Actinomycetospora sp. DW7H6]
MRVLVTGGAGFIGSHVADLLAEKGHEPVLLDDLLPAAHGEPEAPEWVRRHELVRGDVGDPSVLDGLLARVDTVCHQAAMVGHGVDPNDAPQYVRHNDLATAALLAAMYRSGHRRLVLASSMVVYGEGRYACPEHGVVPAPPRRPADVEAGRFDPACARCGRGLVGELIPEDAPLEPRSTYAATKLAQENLAAAWARATGGRVWALRYHNVYGPRMPQNTPYAGVASIFRSALERGEGPRVMEDGAQRRDFVHVTDVAAANLAALESDAGEGSCVPVNVCSGEVRTIGDLAERLAAAMGGPAPEVVGGARPGDVRHITADPARAAEVLGFRASVGFDEGVRAFATDPLRAPVGAPMGRS